MKESYETYNGVGRIESVSDMVSAYAFCKGVDEVDAARTILGGDILDEWLKAHGERFVVA